MGSDWIVDRGRGPELVGTRITVYDLLVHLLDPQATEAAIGQRYGLPPEQVAAARAYVLNHPGEVLAEHLQIESRLAVGNPPEVVEQAARTRATLQRFKDWLAARQRNEKAESAAADDANGGFPSFDEWLGQQSAK